MHESIHGAIANAIGCIKIAQHNKTTITTNTAQQIYRLQLSWVDLVVGYGDALYLLLRLDALG